MTSILLAWTHDLPVELQKRLIGAARGPDVGKCPQVKRVVRWFRYVCFHSTGGSFTRVGKLPTPKAFARQAEWLSQHYINHFAEALDVVAHHHPEKGARKLAADYLAALLRDVAPLVFAE